ncbi:MAG: response regulator [Actinobacteria bacterium]|nr:response regulator [Actinomycetota bacterium]
MKQILVVDDQKAVCYSLKRFLESENYTVQTANSGKEALLFVESSEPDLVLMDVKMPEMNGLEVLEKIKDSYPMVQVIMMTAHSTTEKAIQAIKAGAHDYLLKPFDNHELLSRIEDALKTKAMTTGVVSFDILEEETAGNRIIGKSPGMLEIYKQIGKIAPTDATVLIIGESGTGKELIARAIYHHSSRSKKPFLAINCAAIPEQLLESELFGYEPGAFTGANFKRIGKFEQCNDGTLFLDEIGDLPFSLQAKLLRVLHDGKFSRLGGSQTIKSDVRIIAATHRNLEEMVKNGTFREDLFFRIAVTNIDLPSLRERKEDIKDLVQYFIQKYNKQHGKAIKGLTLDALKNLEEYSWPGNVRELENTIQNLMVFCNNEFLTLECRENPFNQRKCCESIDDAIKNIVDLAFNDKTYGTFQEIIEKIEKTMIQKALELTNGNQVRAAELLKISRNTLRKKMIDTPV